MKCLIPREYLHPSSYLSRPRSLSFSNSLPHRDSFVKVESPKPMDSVEVIDDFDRETREMNMPADNRSPLNQALNFRRMSSADSMQEAAEKFRQLQQQLLASQMFGQSAAEEQKPPSLDESVLSTMAELLNSADYQRAISGVMSQLIPPGQTPVQHPLAPAATNPDNPAFRALVVAHNAQASGFPFGVYPNLEMTDAMRQSGFPGPFGFNPYMMDPSRRKNATREATKPLKQWLNAHRKYPYPNKGDKLMLTMMTGMSLTQVSTWFANARRRLKKENKMTWSPRNPRPEDDEDDDNNKDAFNDSHEPHSPSGSIHSDGSRQDTSTTSLDEKKAEAETPKRKIWSITDTLSQPQPSATANSSPDDRKSDRTVSPPSSSSSSELNQSAGAAALPSLPGFGPLPPFFPPNHPMLSPLQPNLMAMFAQMQHQARLQAVHPLQGLFGQPLAPANQRGAEPPLLSPMTFIQNMMQQQHQQQQQQQQQQPPHANNSVDQQRAESNSSVGSDSPSFPKNNCAAQDESAGVAEQPA